MADIKPATIKDIARQAGVSISTVSRVLNDSAPVAAHKRAAVLRAIELLDYRPNAMAQALASGASQTIGVLTQNISSPFYDAILRGILYGLTTSRYSPLFADGYWQVEREKQAIRTLIERQIDGLLVLGGALPRDYLLSLVAEVPLVVIGRALDGVPCILLDDYNGAYLATRHLLGMGHRRIAHITGLPHHEDAGLRRAGYLQALRDHGLTPNPQLVVEGDFTEQSGVQATEGLLARGVSFSAIFCANDQMAFGARLTLHRYGRRVPEEVSLVGFDDQPTAAYMLPPLTTIRQPAIEIGIGAVQALLARLDGISKPLPAFSATLIARESVTRLRSE